MSSNRSAIEVVRDATKNDAEALAQIFEVTTISDDGTVAGRLRSILQATDHLAVPGLQTGIKFEDKGFRLEFQDIWKSSNNQVGHFLTAVGLSFNPMKVEQPFAGRRLRDWLGAPDAMSAEDVALRLTIGHEKEADPGTGTKVVGGLLGLGTGTGLVGAAAGAALAVLLAFRDQFHACTDADIQAFKSAERALGTSATLDMRSSTALLEGGIHVVPTQTGNSYQDLRLSLYGWRLGQDVKAGRFRAGAEVGTWVRANIKES
jgi:hypothetical protein